MITIAVMMQKGGVGKTTTAQALAAGLHARGHTVLIVDLDPQQNLTFAEGVDPYSEDMITLYDVLQGGASITDAVQSVMIGLDIITGGLALASADMQFSGAIGREQLLKKQLVKVRGSYDYCLIDCPPSLGLLSMCAAVAADTVLIPMTVDILALQGLSHLYNFLQSIQAYYNPELTISGILLTLYNDKAVTTKALEEQIHATADDMGTRVYNTRVHRSQAIQTAQAARQIDVYGRTHIKAVKDYQKFTEEFMMEG